MHEVRGEMDRPFQRRLQRVVRRQLVKLREQADRERVIAGIAAFVFLEPALLVLPVEHALEPLRFELVPAIALEKPRDFLKAEHDERLVIREPPALVMARKPVRAACEKIEQLLVVELEQRVALDPREQRKGGRARGFFKRKIIVARAVRVRTARGVDHAGLGPLLDRRLMKVAVARDRQRVGERERPDELRRHAAGKIDDLVVPEIAVEAAVRRRVRVAILQREDLRNLRERVAGEEVAAHSQLFVFFFIFIFIPAAHPRGRAAKAHRIDIPADQAMQKASGQSLPGRLFPFSPFRLSQASVRR